MLGAPQLAVALDLPTWPEASRMAGQLRGVVPWLKVGLELFVASGPQVVAELKAQGFHVFLDLKFHDIPNTVRGAVRSASRLGADLLTLHASGGTAMLSAAAQGRQDARDDAGTPGPLLVAVTVLTSLGEQDLDLYAAPSLPELADTLAGLAVRAGLDGVVCSAFEAARIKARFGAGLVCVTPGIRLADASRDDQRRVADPAMAVVQGANLLVVGRPITHAQDPATVARTYLAAMASVTSAPGERP